MCMKSDDCELQERVNAIDKRVTNLEGTVAEMRKESQSGFARMTEAINALGHDFGNRMNILDQRIVEEKAKEDERKYAEQVKWGEVKRNIATWAARLILLGCASAMGMTAWKMIFGN